MKITRLCFLVFIAGVILTNGINSNAQQWNKSSSLTYTEFISMNPLKGVVPEPTTKTGKEPFQITLNDRYLEDVEAADVDLDGISELIILTNYDYSATSVREGVLTVYKWNGSDFVVSWQSAGYPGYPYGFQMNDFNMDGYPDIQFSGGNGLQLFINQQDGSFIYHSELFPGSPDEKFAMSDLDNDGFPDLAHGSVGVSNYSVQLYQQDPVNSTLNYIDTLEGTPGNNMVSAFKSNYDLYNDLVFGELYSGDVNVYTNDGSFNFTRRFQYAFGNRVFDVNSADFDLDGMDDFIVSVGWGNIYFFRNLDGNNFEIAHVGGDINSCPNTEVVDLNFDGLPDLVAASFDGNIFIYENLGGFAFNEKVVMVAPNGSNYGLGIGDFNGDGLLDAAYGMNPVNILFDIAGAVDDYVDIQAVDIIFEEPCDLQQQVSIEFINNGTLPASDINLEFRVNDQVFSNEVIPGPILPGETIIHPLTGQIDILVADYSTVYQFFAWITIDGELNTQNNAVSKSQKFFNSEHTDKLGWETYNPCNTPMKGTAMVSSVVEDFSGNIWAGTEDGGAIKYEDGQWIEVSVESGDLLCNSIENMLVDDLGNVWVAYLEGEGASMFDGSQWVHYNITNCDIVAGSIARVLHDSHGNYWFASYVNGVSHFDGVNWTTYNVENGSLPNNRVIDIIEDRNGVIWMGTDNGVVKITNGIWEVLTTANSGLTANRVYELFEDSKGNIWFGVFAYEGLTMFDGTNWHNYHPGNSGLDISVVLGMSEDTDGNIWFGTYDAGVSVMMQDRWITYNTSNGLVDNFLWGDVLQDSNGDYWMPTYGGLVWKSKGSFDYLETNASRPSCSGSSDGIIHIDAISGSYPIEYSVDGGATFQTDSIFEGLATGAYPIVVKNGLHLINPDTIIFEDLPDYMNSPVIESFDGPLFDQGWYQGNTTADWILRSDSTMTYNTGPNSDHTSGSGQYMYVEASAKYYEWAELYSPCFDISPYTSPKLNFYYHMYGVTMGDLHIDVQSEGVWIEDVFVLYGNQGDAWQLASIDLSNYGSLVKLRFRAKVGRSAFSDIAIDDLSITSDYSNLENHFETVWDGNGVDHMNFYVISAELDGIPLQEGDEIAVFDGEHCVGVGILTEVIVDGVNYLTMRASKNDADPPAINGFTPGNSVTYAIWDVSEQIEIGNVEATYVAGAGIFSVGGTATFHLSATSQLEQSIDLSEGWNILSFAVEPVHMSMDSIFKGEKASAVLVKIQDEAGSAMEELPFPIGWINNIGEMSVTKGYKTKVAADVTVLLKGMPVALPVDIPLVTGWNIIGYPCMESNLTALIFGALKEEECLLKVQDEQGNAIEELPFPIGWIDNIVTLEPGEGYKIKVCNENSVEIWSSAFKTASTRNGQQLASEYFMPSWEGNGLDHMNIYLKSPTYNGMPLMAGDAIGIFDGDICVGYGVVMENAPELLSLVASKDDPLTEDKDGFTEDNELLLKLRRSNSSEVVRASRLTPVAKYELIFKKNGTSLLQAEFLGEVCDFLGDAYPNPARGQTTFTFGLAETGAVTLEILNNLGQVVAVLVNDEMGSGIHTVIWDHSGDKAGTINNGTYFYRMTTQQTAMTKPIIIIK